MAVFNKKKFVLTHDGRLQVDEDRSRDVLAAGGLGEEGAEGIVGFGRRIIRDQSVRMNSVFKTGNIL